MVNENILGEPARVTLIALAVHCRPCKAALALATCRVERAANHVADKRRIDTLTDFNNWSDELMTKNVGRLSGKQTLSLVNIRSTNTG